MVCGRATPRARLLGAPHCSARRTLSPVSAPACRGQRERRCDAPVPWCKNAVAICRRDMRRPARHGRRGSIASLSTPHSGSHSKALRNRQSCLSAFRERVARSSPAASGGTDGCALRCLNGRRRTLLRRPVCARTPSLRHSVGGRKVCNRETGHKSRACMCGVRAACVRCGVRAVRRASGSMAVTMAEGMSPLRAARAAHPPSTRPPCPNELAHASTRRTERPV